MAGPGLVTTAVLLLLCWGTHQSDAQGPTVSITVSGSPPPGFTPGPDEYRAASGRFDFTCTATGGAGSGDYQFVWTTTCNISACTFVTSMATTSGATSEFRRTALHSGDGGTHTCTATRGGESGSDTVTVNIVGIGINAFTPVTGAQPNNGLVISNNPGSGRRFFFDCRTNSSAVGVGEFIGLDGSAIDDATNNFFEFQDTGRLGEISIINNVGSETLLSASEQGVYTCRLPFEGGGKGEFNIGIYPNGFNTMPTITNPLVFTPGFPSSTLTCTSTGSPATTVTFMRGSTTVGPLRDGESVVVSGVTYQLTQTVTNRAQSTYENVLTINQPLSDIEDSTFTCRVDNAIGTSLDSQDLTVNAIGISGPAETPTVGGTATFTCTSLLGMAGTIEWLLVDGTETTVVMNSGQATLDLVLDPVSESMNGGVYRCRVTISGATVDQDITVTVQVPTVSVMTSASGSAVAGEEYSITCAVMGADNLDATFRVEWQRPGGDTLRIGLMSSLTHTFSPLGQGDAGQYTCEARISTDLLLASPLTRTDMLDITVAAAPGPVSNIQWEPQSASSVSVSWSPPQMPNGVILRYSVILERYEDGLIIDSRELDGNVFTTIFTDNRALVAEVPYKVTVTARNSDGEGDPVEIVDFTEESNSPPPPSNVTILRTRNGREILVSWTPLTLVEARSLIQFYRVTFDPVGASRKRQSGAATCTQSPCDVPSTEISVVITGLDPSTSYVVQVSVVNGGGQRGPSAVVIAEAETPACSGTGVGAIVGGVVAVLGLLIIASAVIIIVFLVLRHHNHQSSLSVEQHTESVKLSEVAKSEDQTTECIAYSPVTHQPQDTEYIPTAPCEAYGQSQQTPRVQDGAVYEIIPGEGNLPSGQI